MKIEHNSEASGGQFTAVDENNKKIGIMSYTLTGAEKEKMAIEHTSVNPAFEGKGVGHSLVKEGVRYAREHQLKIVPVCWFVRLVIDRNPEMKDILV